MSERDYRGENDGSAEPHGKGFAHSRKLFLRKTGGSVGGRLVRVVQEGQKYPGRGNWTLNTDSGRWKADVFCWFPSGQQVLSLSLSLY